jgi:hypothetical protein
MFSNRRYSEKTLEVSLYLIVAAMATMLYFFAGYKLIVLVLFFLPVVLAGAYLGRHRGGILALIASLLTFAVAAIDLEAFGAGLSPLVIGFGLTLWGGTLGLTAIFVGTLSDERRVAFEELHDAHVGVVEVICQYLKSADPRLEHRTKRVVQLCELVADELRLKEKDKDELRIAAQLHGMDNIEVTARVIRRAVGTFHNAKHNDQHTFHGTDLMQSLGDVLAGALPLILGHTERLESALNSEETVTSQVTPLGACVIHAVVRFVELTHDPSTGMEDREAIKTLQADLDDQFHPTVLHALEHVLARLDAAGSEEVRLTDELRELVGAEI